MKKIKIHDNTDEPKVNGYILGNQNHVGFYFNGYVYYFGFSAYKAYPRKTHLQNWCKKWVYLNEMCAEKKEEYMEAMGIKDYAHIDPDTPKAQQQALSKIFNCLHKNYPMLIIAELHPDVSVIALNCILRIKTALRY